LFLFDDSTWAAGHELARGKGQASTWVGLPN